MKTTGSRTDIPPIPGAWPKSRRPLRHAVVALSLLFSWTAPAFADLTGPKDDPPPPPPPKRSAPQR